VSDEGFPDLRQALSLDPEGIAVEFGVAGGHSTRLIAGVMPVIGFDSWQGLPEDWREEFPAGSMKCPKPVVENAQLVEGWFDDTVPVFPFRRYNVGLVHIDCDLYSSTTTAFTHVGPVLKPGCLIVLDDYDENEPHVFKAFWEAVAKFGWKVEQLSGGLFRIGEVTV
jgi:predicted O-methyltransferase YrrM